MEPTKTEKIIKSLRKKLSKSGWDTALWAFWASTEFEQIIDKLQEESAVGNRWIPGADLMFRFLYSCPYNKVKIVMLVDMTTTTWEVNDGIPMSNMNGNRLNKLVYAMVESMPTQSNNPTIPSDLAVWAKQGVLMIPTAPTAIVGKWGHYDIWKPLIAYLIDHINHNKPQVPWLLLGTRAAEYSQLIHTDKVQERKFYTPFKEDGLWSWLEEQVILNEQIPIEWIK